jgi:hypothetical protein
MVPAIIDAAGFEAVQVLGKSGRPAMTARRRPSAKEGGFRRAQFRTEGGPKKGREHKVSSMNSKYLRLPAGHVIHLSMPLGNLVPQPGWESAWWLNDAPSQFIRIRFVDWPMRGESMR